MPNSATVTTVITAQTSRLVLRGASGAVIHHATSADSTMSIKNAPTRAPIDATDPSPLSGRPSARPGNARSAGPSVVVTPPPYAFVRVTPRKPERDPAATAHA